MAVKKKVAAKSRPAKAAPTAKKTNKAAKTTKTTKTTKASKSAKKVAPVSAKAAPAAKAYSTAPIAQKQTKAEILAEIAELTGVAKSEVKVVFSALRNVTERHLKGKGVGEFVIPEVGIKVRRISKPATKARVGRNPFTGEEITIAAKPARKSVKATAMKALKALAG